MLYSFVATTAAVSAGWELHARSKLYLGFAWALLPPPGLEEWYRAAINLSLVVPMLIAAIVILELLPPGHRLLHTIWPVALATLLGLLSPIVYFAWKRRYRT